MRSLSTVAGLLLDAHRRATSARGESAALYLVRLTELAGLALAVAVHEVTGGPDPTVLRERAVGAGVSKPVMAGAVALDMLTRALEGLAVLGEAERRLLVTSLRGIHERGGVPVLILLDGVALVRSLADFAAPGTDAEPLAWSLPSLGDA